MNCTLCKKPFDAEREPHDGWDLGDGRVLCNFCAAVDLHRISDQAEITRWQENAGKTFVMGIFLGMFLMLVILGLIR